MFQNLFQKQVLKHLGDLHKEGNSSPDWFAPASLAVFPASSEITIWGRPKRLGPTPYPSRANAEDYDRTMPSSEFTDVASNGNLQAEMGSIGPHVIKSGTEPRKGN